MIVPVFPRPNADPVGSDHYVHALDDTTLGIEDGPLERVDLQLISMIEDATERLRNEGYAIRDDGVLLNGFSAAAFVDRFTLIHPEAVLSVTPGGQSQTSLPIVEQRGQQLPFPIGTADLADYVGEAFDLEAYRNVAKLFYLGDLDGNDSIPLVDAWPEDERLSNALDIYGRSPQRERVPRSRADHEAVDAQSHFRLYRNVGHDAGPATDDIIAFHEQALEGTTDDVDFPVREGYPAPSAQAAIVFEPIAPAPGEQVVFDASRSGDSDESFDDVTWTFDDGTTEAGEYVHHTFETEGAHSVQLAVTDADGTVNESDVLVSVRRPEPQHVAFIDPPPDDDDDEDPPPDDDDEDPPPDDDDDEDSPPDDNDDEDPPLDGDDTVPPDETDDDDGMPGFGIVSGIGVLGGVGYVLSRRFSDSNDD